MAGTIDIPVGNGRSVTITCGVHPQSPFAIACGRLGLEPDKTSYVRLASRSIGSDSDLTLQELKRRYGDNWTHLACK